MSGENNETLNDRLRKAYSTVNEPGKYAGNLNDDWALEVFTLVSIFRGHGREENEELYRGVTIDRDKLRTFTTAFIEGASKERRLEVLSTMLEMCEQRPTRADTVMSSFLYLDTDPQILSSAALYVCGCSMPGEDGDVTFGAKNLIKVIEDRLESGFSSEAGVLAGGLLLFGDERFRARMNEVWGVLDEEGRRQMARAHSGFATKAHIDFLLDHLESTEDEAEYGGLAAALARLADVGGQGGIHEIERVVPVSISPDEPINLIESWTLTGFMPQIMPRLEALAEAEDPAEAVMPIVIERWSQE